MMQAATLQSARSCFTRQFITRLASFVRIMDAPFKLLWFMSSVESARIWVQASGRVPIRLL